MSQISIRLWRRWRMCMSPVFVLLIIVFQQWILIFLCLITVFIFRLLTWISYVLTRWEIHVLKVNDVPLIRLCEEERTSESHSIMCNDTGLHTPLCFDKPISYFKCRVPTPDEVENVQNTTVYTVYDKFCHIGTIRIKWKKELGRKSHSTSVKLIRWSLILILTHMFLLVLLDSHSLPSAPLFRPRITPTCSMSVPIKYALMIMK